MQISVELYYNVHLLWSDQTLEKHCIAALSKEDVLNSNTVKEAINLGAYVLKIIGPLGKPATRKQKLAQKYGFMQGSIKGMLKTFQSTLKEEMRYGCISNDQLNTLASQWSLVEKQISKLQRDLAATFKTLGLKIK